MSIPEVMVGLSFLEFFTYDGALQGFVLRRHGIDLFVIQ